MAYGPLAPKKLPEQDVELLLLLLDRWQRAAGAHAKWAEPAKKCIDAVEGRQWDQGALAKLKSLGRPALTINKINRLVRLVLGLFMNNQMDLRYLPGHDGSGLDTTAEALTAVAKQISEANQLPYIDTEVFLDGIMTGRGFFNHRLCFEDNDFGELGIGAQDPFATYLDPDAEGYDLNGSLNTNGCGYIVTARMACLDEIEHFYGKSAREAVQPFAYGRTPLSQYYVQGPAEEISPVRRFGQSEDSQSEWWDTVYSQLGSFVDPLRKSLRIMDFQHIMYRNALHFVDLETGDRTEIPEKWPQEKIQKVMWWAQAQGHHIAIDRRMAKKTRWTTVVGDLIVYNNWSPYKTYSITGFFPYFRRGVTRGMVEDLLDPNMEINKRRSARVDIITRSAHSGWKYHKQALEPHQKEALKIHGSEAGFNLEWTGELGMEPKKIEPSAPPQGMRELEQDGASDLTEVSGVNESALGEIDIGQSGRAIEARQRQAMVAVQVYFTNFSRSKELQGRKVLECIQEHYTEQRLFRVLGTDGKVGQPVFINQREMDPTTNVSRIVNDVTIGRYRIAVDESPLAATFASAQFEEMLALLQKLGPIGQALAGLRPDLIIDLSSLPRKEEWKAALLQAVSAQQQPPMGQPNPGGGAPPPGPPGAAAPPPSGQPQPPPVAAPANNVIPLAR